MAWGLDYFPDDQPEFECCVCGAPLFEDVYVCSDICFKADLL